MIATIARVLAAEGAGSAMRRAQERIAGAAREVVLRTGAPFAGTARAEVVNIAPDGLSPRTGGVAVQLAARLRFEQTTRNVAVLHGQRLELFAPFAHVRRARNAREAMALTGARALHIENTHGADFAEILQWIDDGIPVVVSVHDFSLYCSDPHRLDVRSDDTRRRESGRRILDSAAAVIFPSHFLLEEHRKLFDLPLAKGHVIEPSSGALRAPGGGREIAYAGSVKRHKGGHLLPDIAAALDRRGRRLHVFGGGDADLLLPLRRHANVVIHGYHRAGTLPELLARNGVGVALLASVWPETYSLTLSESWLAGASVIAFDLGAIAERVKAHGGGTLVPLESGARGLIEAIDAWQPMAVPDAVASPADAARAHIDLYRTLLS